MNRSADDDFSAADIAESEPEESGDQGELNSAGERLAKTIPIDVFCWIVNDSACHSIDAESNCCIGNAAGSFVRSRAI